MAKQQDDNRFQCARILYNQHGPQDVTTVHNQTGISRSQIFDLEAGKSRGVSYLTIVELAKYYNVSTDYLVGLSDAPTRNDTIQNIHKVTGLSQEAIVTLNILNNSKDKNADDVAYHSKAIDLINLVFYDAWKYVEQYIKDVRIESKLINEYIDSLPVLEVRSKDLDNLPGAGAAAESSSCMDDYPAAGPVHTLFTDMMDYIAGDPMLVYYDGNERREISGIVSLKGQDDNSEGHAVGELYRMALMERIKKWLNEKRLANKEEERK